MSDYGTPIGYYCPVVDKQRLSPGAVEWYCEDCTHIIPVYNPIPEGQRPSTHEPRPDDVITYVVDQALYSRPRRWLAVDIELLSVVLP